LLAAVFAAAMLAPAAAPAVDASAMADAPGGSGDGIRQT
jgi:hypothetical protein